MNLNPKRLASLIWSSLILFALPVRGAVVTATFTSASTVPVTAASYTATGNTVNITLSFAPSTGTNLKVVNNTGLALIQGTFDNLAQGQKVNLTYGGISYPFVANYFGGDGNDLVLQWANTRLFAWGSNSNGQLGNNTTNNSSVPVAVDITGVLAGKVPMNLSAGGSHCLAVCADGTVVAWGANSYGQLGSSSTTDSWVPVGVNQAGALAGKMVTAVAAGENHSLALCADGTLVAWGTNDSGQLGNGGTSTSTEPVPVNQTGVLAGKTVTAIAAGYSHCLALCSDGTLAGWGSNSYGELGNGITTLSSVPVLVNRTGVLAGKTVTAISTGGSSSSGGDFSFAVCSDGTVAGWGLNGYGQLGNGSYTNSNVPVAVTQSGVLSGKTVVTAAAEDTSCVVLCSNGIMAAWGNGSSGQLGNSANTNSNVPVLVTKTGVLAGKTVSAIAAGHGQAFALCTDATLVAWGNNGSGQVGDNSTSNRNAPVLVNTTTLRAGERFTAIRGGSNHSLAMTASPPPPLATTLAASGIGDSGATLNGNVAANGNTTTVSFEYGLTTSYGASVGATPASLTGTATAATSATLTGLLPGSTYHYRVVASGTNGTSKGADASFTTTTTACLAGLTADTGTLVPAFDFKVSSYEVVVPAATAHLTVTAVTVDSAASLTVNGTALASGTGFTLDLVEGSNQVSVVVTAADHVNTRTYSVKAIRLPAVYAFNSASVVPVTVADFSGTGNTATFALNFVPVAGTNLMVVKNTGPGPIRGPFDNLAQGQAVNLTFGGVAYSFVANYWGGSGNDLVLQWANTRLLDWGANASGQLGNGSLNSTTTGAGVDMSGVLAGKAVISVATRSNHNLALCSDGTMAAWGYNLYGQLGNNSSTDSSVPVEVTRTGVLAGKTVVSVAAGGNHSLVLCSDGTLAAWGDGSYGQLGNGSSTFSAKLPVLVDLNGVLAGKTVVAIAAGGDHCLALCADGTLVAWGNNTNGELGNGSTNKSLVPVLVTQSGALAGRTVIAIAAGPNHSLALCADGTLAAWGYNYYGQLGNGSTTNSSVPVLVIQTGVLAGKTITALAAGSHHTLALCSDGTLAAWGYNSVGELGDGSTTNSSVPVLVTQSGMLAGKTVTAIAAGGSHSLALCSDGTVAAWGYNPYGQLGDGSKTDSSVPVAVNTTPLRTGERFAAIKGGGSHSLALVASPPPPLATTQPATGIADTGTTLNGTVNAQASSTGASFEYGLTTSYGATATATPATVTGTTVTTVSATISGLLSGVTYHYRVVASSGGGTVRGADMTFTTSTAACLSGLSTSGGALMPALDKNITSYSLTVPSDAAAVTLTPLVLTAGATVTVAGVAVDSGTASAPLALTTGNNAINVVVTAAGGGNTKTYTVTVTRVPAVLAFNSSSSVPVTVADFNATGLVANWALNYAPAVGTTLTVVRNTGTNPIQGTFANLAQGQLVPLTYGGVTYPFVANYFGGTGNDLVLQWAKTRMLAWGYNSLGQLGNNSTTNSSVPVAVLQTGVLAGKTVVAVAAGSGHGLALCADGTLAAWGYNSYGQLGNGSSTNSGVPVLVTPTGVLAGKTVVAIDAGESHSLALCSDGTLVTWGDNTNGQLGNGGTTKSMVPVLVTRTGALAGRTVVAIAAGSSHNLALCSDGTLAAWGYNYSGQLGNGSTTNSSVPALVTQTGVLAGKTITALAAGSDHTLALCSDGTLAAWGYNSDGELGDGTNKNRTLPVWVTTSGVLAGKTLVSVVAGGYHSLALCSDGTLAAWGDGFWGKLGNGNTSSSSVPVLVTQSGVLAGKAVTAIAAGGDHSIALCSDGAVAAWGYNSYGQLGNGSSWDSNVPALVSTTPLRTGERFVAASGGGAHSLALVGTPPPPAATTLAATVIIDTGAILNGSVNAAGASTSVSFEYGLTTNYGTTVAADPATVSGTVTTAVSKAIGGLTAGATYHYRVVATNLYGTTRGADMTFTTTNDNPDGDGYDNLIEYAFNLPPASGAGSPFSISPSASPTGRVELSFTRPVGATASVTYYLEYSNALGPATSWISIPLNTINPRNIDIVAIDELTERVTIRNLEAREAFVRFRVELDANGDRITDHISYTGVEGWTESTMKPGTRTYNNPYQHEAVFTGTVDATGGVSGQSLRFTTSAGSTDLGTLLIPGVAYYVEVTAGPNEGQRFDVASASGNALTLAATSDVCSDTPPFGTLAGAPPATLAGNRIAIHRHWSLGELFPVGRFLAADDAAAADQVQTSATAANTYWLCSNGGQPEWVRLGDATLVDQGTTVIAPGRGLMVLKRGTGTSVLAYGGVRANNFVRPLCTGSNLVGGGWPIVQSATDRRMDAAHGFLGSTDPATADMFSIWKGDATSGATAYDDYYLYDSATAPKWVRTGDTALTPVDAQLLFLGDRAVLIQMRNDMHGYTIPNPLNGAEQSAAPMQGLAASGTGQDAASALIAHAFGLGAAGGGALPQGKLVGDSYVIEFTEPAGVTGITYGAEYSATLLPGSWTEVPDTGTGSAHIFSVPVTGGSLFMRLRVTGH